MVGAELQGPSAPKKVRKRNKKYCKLRLSHTDGLLQLPLPFLNVEAAEVPSFKGSLLADRQPGVRQ